MGGRRHYCALWAAVCLWGAPWVACATPPVLFRTPPAYDPDWPVVATLLASKCAACHRAGTERTDVTSYAALLEVPEEGDPLVTPGDLEKSTIWEYVAWNAAARTDCDDPDEPMMPPDHQEWLTAGQLETLRRWIERGAQQLALPDACGRPPLSELDFPSARQCKTCHPRQYSEWSRSMHAYAQHSPVFEAFNLTLVERSSGTIGTFCSRCHTPVGTTLGERADVRNVHRSQLSMEGVTCVACHRRSTPLYKSSGRVSIEPGSLAAGCVYGPFDDAVSAEHNAHPSAKFPYLKQSQFCGDCHDVTNPQGVRLEEAFSEWQNSPAAKCGIRCQDCHMGPVQGVPIPEEQRPLGRAAVVPGVNPEKLPLRRLSNHSFSGPDYSLLPDTEFPRKLDWMYEVDYRDAARLTPHQQRTLQELRRENRESLEIATRQRVEVLRNGAKLHVAHPGQGRVGQRVRVQADVESLFSGHSYPTGFTAERQLWVAIEIRDPSGRVVYCSGDLDHNGDLRDEHSHEVLQGQSPVDWQLLNFQSKFVALTAKGTERSVVLSVNRHLDPLTLLRPANGISASIGRPPVFRVAKSSLPPLRTMGRDYPFVPASAGWHTIHARLRFRHLPPILLDNIGVSHLKHLLEIVEIDEYQGRFHVGP